MSRVWRARTDQLATDQLAALRELMRVAFAGDEHGGFSDEDWQHALGGMHFVIDIDGTIVAHASVVERELEIDGKPIRTGYVEAVATAPEHQRKGHGSAVMRVVNAWVAERFDLGALGTGSQAFYERLGWKIWRGHSHVRTDRGLLATPDENGYILVLLTPTTPPIDLNAPISCEWRPGDVW